MNTAAKPRAGHVLLVPVLAVLAAALLLVAGGATSAKAASGLDSAAAALRDGPVYVDPRASDALPDPRADALGKTIRDADKPVFVAVLPKAGEFDRSTLLQDLRARVGVTGVYVVALGDRLGAGADPQVMSNRAVDNLRGTVERAHPGDVAAMTTDFVDQAVGQADGTAPASWNGGAAGDTSAGSFLAGVAVLVGLFAVVLGGVSLLGSAGRKRRDREEREQLETLRPVVDEDITAFGEALDRLDFSPSESGADDAMRTDYARALDAYEDAKDAMAGATGPGDVRRVTGVLEDGRFALATLDARRTGEPLPERRPPCFFDPRHGPSAQDVQWAPPSGAERSVPVCAADAARLAEGEEPESREVDTAQGRRPYWEAGPAYGPWVYGYFGGGVLPGLLMGTMLGSAMTGPHAWGYGGLDGGDVSGADFDPGDFGGGFGGGDFGGGFGGGDFGGGFGGF
ncbi:hypothetical protein [Streptomyces sp. TR02-1]|uniref:hypothetical protein n=1 Tax=Streptomyces sp. TR02-1 TaxID=3385977 RepID=UPI0039A079D3